MANLNVTIPALKLNDGASIPMLGYGVGTAWGKKEEGKVDQAIIDGVKTAIKLGYYHLDGAECKFRTDVSYETSSVLIEWQRTRTKLSWVKLSKRVELTVVSFLSLPRFGNPPVRRATLRGHCNRA